MAEKHNLNFIGILKFTINNCNFTPALGIVAASFAEVRSKDTAESPTEPLYNVYIDKKGCW